MLKVKKLLIPFLSVLLVLNAIAQDKRLALVIGNSNYTHGGTLANPENDADAISEKLIDLGFNVLSHKNVDQKSMQQMIDDFGIMLKHYDVGLFFFAGHGIQAKGTNYLIPVDANIRTENDIEYNCVKAGRLLAKMEDAGSKVNIMILDACRDNPFERGWTRSAAGKGLAFMNSPVGTLIAYSTAPGTTASDGYETNSPYTSALINYISQPNITILQMFQHVRKEVRENTNNMQIPWESTSLEGNFYFITKNNILTEPPATDLKTVKTEYTPKRDKPGYLVDPRDGKKYKTVNIGNQLWMAQNLNYEDNNIESFCYSNNDLYCHTFGRFYPWNSAMKACPSGWHLPSDNEWKELEISLGMAENDAIRKGESYFRGIPLGKKLHEDEVIGFKLLYTGYAFHVSGDIYDYWGKEMYTCFWTSTKTELNTAYFRQFYIRKEGIKRDDTRDLKKGFTVRCVKD